MRCDHVIAHRTRTTPEKICGRPAFFGPYCERHIIAHPHELARQVAMGRHGLPLFLPAWLRFLGGVGP